MNATRALHTAALERARRALAVLEEQAAGYTALTIPASLVIDLQDKRKEIQRLEALLAGKGEELLNNLPRRTPFFGRAHEIEHALAALQPEDRGWGLVIDGIGGIGKTTLAVEVAHLCLERGLFDLFLFTSAKLTRLTPSGEQCLPEATATLEGMFNELAHLLGEPGVAQMGRAEKQRGLLTALRQATGPQRRALLLFDNLETLAAEDQASLYEFLRRLPQDCKAIVTSRKRAGDGAVWLRLEKLDWEATQQLIADQVRRAPSLGPLLAESGEAGWRRLHDATGGSPLALLWILGLMRARNMYLGRALEILQAGARQDTPLHEFIYREARREMGESDWRALGSLSLFATPATYEAVKYVSQLATDVLDAVLERLLAFSLVDVYSPDQSYGLHPLTRRLAANELSRQPEMAYTLQERFIRYWLDFAHVHGGSSRNYARFDRLEAAWPNQQMIAAALYEQSGLPEALRHPEAARRLVSLAETLGSFLWFRGYWDEWICLSGWAYEAAEALRDEPAAGRAAYDIAGIYYSRDDTEAASLWTERMAAAMQQAGDRLGQITALSLRGLLAQQKGDLETAAALLQQALDAHRQLGLPVEEAATLNNLGDIAQAARRYQAAQDYYEQALAINSRLADKEGQAIDCCDLGDLCLERGQAAPARAWYERTLGLAREVGRRDLVAQAQYGLARLLEAEGNLREALPLAEESLHLCERIHHRNRDAIRLLVERLRQKG